MRERILLSTCLNHRVSGLVDIAIAMEELRPSLILYAYNILGSYEDAKDVVQDVFLKFSQHDLSIVQDQKLYLIRMVVNLAIDRKRRQKRQRADYPGQWLPEPFATDDPETTVQRKQILSYSLMVLLEKLDSKQRAVFILKEAFDYSHEDIARVLGITVENSRKVLSRAKDELQNVPARGAFQHDAVQQYLAVLEKGDMRALERMLSDEVTVISDGGGKVAAFMNIIEGIQSVSALLAGLYKKIYRETETRPGLVNHQPALFYYVNGQLVTCQIFGWDNGRLKDIFFVRNPDKMSTLKKNI